MSKRDNSKEHICPYCCVQVGTTKDHVIPRCLFPASIPNGINLPTVKACAECNNVRKSGDDTYLRDVLLTDAACSTDPAAQALLKAEANRAMRRTQSAFAKYVHKNKRRVHLVTQSGLYVGQGYTAKVDVNRLHRIFVKITRGLYFKQQRELLPRNLQFMTMRGTVEVIAKIVKTPDLKWYLRPNSAMFLAEFIV